MVGKTTDTWINEGVENYIKRIYKYATLEFIILPSHKGSLIPKEIKEKEGKAILKVLPEKTEIILMDEKGKLLNSVDFSNQLEKEKNEGKKHCFVIGGAYGFSEDVYQKATSLISLSKMTFSHQLVRLVLVEQLYRALNIMARGSYHHD